VSLPESFFRDKFRNAMIATTFRDVILSLGKAEVEPQDVNLHTRVTKQRQMKIPFISSPMDTVTESEMAIALARHGGLGVLHRNCTVEEQCEMAKRVKKAEALVIRDVVTVTPSTTIAEALTLMQKHEISGLPVVDNDRLVGILTGRDVRFADPSLKVENLMTRKVITAREGITIDDAKELLHQHRIEKLPIVDADGKLSGLITIKDIILRGRFPDATRDGQGRLLCAAAISPFDTNRARELDKYVDILAIDVAHFHNTRVFEATKKLMKEVNAEVIVGNIGTFKAAEEAITKLDRVAAFRVGVGSGSICSTTAVTRAGAPTLFATCEIADAVREYGAGIPIIADGGVRGAGDVAVALAAGASAVMIGNLFARCKEAPGTLLTIGGRHYKQYRGMGSPSARAKRYAIDRYSTPAKGLPEGVEGWVPYKGEVALALQELVAGLQAAMGYAGTGSISDLWDKASFLMISQYGEAEAAPHDILLPSETERA
jgi:IMP dehydrogenase